MASLLLGTFLQFLGPCLTFLGPAPGGAAYQLELAAAENIVGHIPGSTSWLARGLRIQESQ